MMVVNSRRSLKFTFGELINDETKGALVNTEMMTGVSLG